MKKPSGSILAQCGAVFVLFLVVWVGTYVGLREFREGRIFTDMSDSFRVIDLPNKFHGVATVYRPFQKVDQMITGQKIEIADTKGRFHIGDTAKF